MKNNEILMDSKEELDKIKHETSLEINKLNKEIKVTRNKKVLKFSLIAITIISLFKLFFGTIELYNIAYYPASRTRFYKVTVNNEPTTVNYNLKHTIPIIPFLVNFNSIYLGGSDIVGDEDPYYVENGSKKYIIDISSYNCYRDTYQVECKNSNQTMKENNDTKYTNLKIIRTTNPYEEIYNGKFIKDITPYINKKGIYYIGITAKYSLVETEVYFYFDKK